MAKSIAQAQADALAKGFFDKLGSSKDDFIPRSSLSSVIKLAGRLLEEADKNLNAADRVASGAVLESMKILDPTNKGGIIVIDIEILYYYMFLDQGVKGTRSGSGKFSFKNEFVPPKMFKALKSWVKKEGLKARTDVGGKPISKRERKRVANRSGKGSERSIDSKVYAIGVSVKRKGLKKTLFWTNAIKVVERIAAEELGKAFVIDILDAIPARIN